MRSKDEDVLNKQLWVLRESSAELAAIAHLFRLKRRDDAPPLDMEEINWGLSRLLDRLARRVKRAARRIEEADINRRRTPTRPKESDS